MKILQKSILIISTTIVLQLMFMVTMQAYSRVKRPSKPAAINGKGRSRTRTTQRGGTVSASVTPTSGSGKNGTYAVTTSSQSAQGTYGGSTTGTVTTTTTGATPSATGSSTTTLHGPSQTKSYSRSTHGTAEGGAYGSGTGSYKSTTTNSNGDVTRTGYTTNTSKGMTQGGTKYGPNGGTRTFASTQAYAGSPTESAYQASHGATTTTASGSTRTTNTTAGWSDNPNAAPTFNQTTTLANGATRQSQIVASGSGTVSGNATTTNSSGNSVATSYDAPKVNGNEWYPGYGGWTKDASGNYTVPVTPEQKSNIQANAQSKSYNAANVGTGKNAQAGVSHLMTNNS